MKLNLFSCLALALIVLGPFAFSLYSYSQFYQFKEDLIKEQARLSLEIQKRENALKTATDTISANSQNQIELINNTFDSLNARIDSMQSDDTSSNKQVPAIANVTNGADARAKSRPLTESERLYRAKLAACNKRLLYEAKEYDILATHYNALLKIYLEAQGVLKHDN